MNERIMPWATVGSLVSDCYNYAKLYNEPRPITKAEAAQQVAAMISDGWEDLPDGLNADSFCYWWNTLYLSDNLF